MKKNILYIGLVALALQSCDYLDREPLDSISKDKFFSTAGADGLQQYCNNLYPKLIKGHGDPQSYNFGMMEEDSNRTTSIHGNTILSALVYT